MRHSYSVRFVSLLLAVLILITSVGLTVQRMTCRMSGRSLVALSVAGPKRPGDCENHTLGKTVARDNCCDFHSQQHKLSPASHELKAKSLVKGELFPVVALESERFVAAPRVVLKATGPHWFAADSSPPPRGGRELLAFVCALLV